MSTYFSIFTCSDCKQSVTVGFIGDTNYTVAFCSACTQSFRVAARQGERLRASNIPHQLLIFGKHKLEVTTRKGRRTKSITHHTWIESGIDIPVDEELVQSGENIYIRYDLNYSEIVCPACQAQGTLIDFRDYLRNCPNCQSGAMDERDL